MQFWLANENETRMAGAALAATLVRLMAERACVVFIKGDLGAGKSTLVRGLLTELGVTGVMPSPTYTLIEPYQVDGLRIYHMDAYRLSDAAELDFLGLDEATDPGALLLVEWPDHVRDSLPAPSITLELEIAPPPDSHSEPPPDRHKDRAEQPLPDRHTHGGEPPPDEPPRDRKPPPDRHTDDGALTAVDPGRRLMVRLEAIAEEERKALFSDKGWQKLTRVVT